MSPSLTCRCCGYLTLATRRLHRRLGDLLLGPAARASRIVADVEARLGGLVPGIPRVRPALLPVHSAARHECATGLGRNINHAHAISRD